MTIHEAINKLKEKVPNKQVSSYAENETGYILICSDPFDILGCNYYEVTNDGQIMATNPVLCKLNKYVIKDI